MKEEKIHNRRIQAAVFLAVILLAGAGGSTFAQTWSAAQRTTTNFTKERPQLALDSALNRVHYVWDEWDGGNYQIWTSEMNAAGTDWGPPDQRTSTLNYSMKPQLVTDSPAGRIYYVYQEVPPITPPYEYQIFTADLNLATGIWTPTRQTSTTGDSQYPQLALYGSAGKIYYAYQEQDVGLVDQLWTAESNLGTGWIDSQDTFTSDHNEFPQLALDRANNMIYYVFQRVGGGGNKQIWTAGRDLTVPFPGGWHTPIQRTFDAADSEYPQLAVDTVNGKIYYVFNGPDGSAYSQIWTAEQDIPSGAWGTPVKRTDNLNHSEHAQLVLDNVNRKIYYVYQEYVMTDPAYQIFTAELDLDTGIWSATKRTTSIRESELPQLVLDRANYKIHYVYQETDTSGDYQIWTAELQYPSPTPTVTPTGTPVVTPTATPTPTPTVTPTVTPTIIEGNYVCVSNGGTSLNPGRTLSVVDPATNQVVRTIDVEVNGLVGWRPKDLVIVNGTVYVVCNDADSVFYGPVSGPMTGYIDVGVEPLGIAVSPDEARAYVTCTGDDPRLPGSGSVSVIDLASKNSIATFPVGRFPNYGIEATSGYVGVTNLLDNSVYLIDSGSFNIIGGVFTGKRTLPLGLEVAERGGRIFWGAALFGDGRTDSVKVLKQSGGRVVWHKMMAAGVNKGGPVDIRLSPRGLLAASLFIGDRVDFYESGSGRLIASVAVPHPGMGAFCPDGDYFYVPSFRGALYRINTEYFVVDSIIPVGSGPVCARYYSGGSQSSAKSNRGFSMIAGPTRVIPGSSVFLNASCSSGANAFGEFLGGIAP